MKKKLWLVLFLVAGVMANAMRVAPGEIAAKSAGFESSAPAYLDGGQQATNTGPWYCFCFHNPLTGLWTCIEVNRP